MAGGQAGTTGAMWLRAGGRETCLGRGPEGGGEGAGVQAVFASAGGGVAGGGVKVRLYDRDKDRSDADVSE